MTEPESGTGNSTGRMTGRWMAIDYGDRRIGLAVSDPTGTIASPAGFILRRAGKRVPVGEIVRRAHAAEIVGFVLGLPLNGDGNETPRCAEVRTIGEKLAAQTGLPVRYVDERFTTASALRTMRDTGSSTRGRKGEVDALAAAILLQHALRVAEGTAPDAPASDTSES